MYLYTKLFFLLVFCIKLVVRFLLDYGDNFINNNYKKKVPCMKREKHCDINNEAFYLAFQITSINYRR